MKTLFAIVTLVFSAQAQAAPSFSYTFPPGATSISGQIVTYANGRLAVVNPTLLTSGNFYSLVGDATNGPKTAAGICYGFGLRYHSFKASATSATLANWLYVSPTNDRTSFVLTRNTIVSIVCK